MNDGRWAVYRCGCNLRERPWYASPPVGSGRTGRHFATWSEAMAWARAHVPAGSATGGSSDV